MILGKMQFLKTMNDVGYSKKMLVKMFFYWEWRRVTNVLRAKK